MFPYTRFLPPAALIIDFDNDAEWIFHLSAQTINNMPLSAGAIPQPWTIVAELTRHRSTYISRTMISRIIISLTARFAQRFSLSHANAWLEGVWSIWATASSPQQNFTIVNNSCILENIPAQFTPDEEWPMTYFGRALAGFTAGNI